MAISAITTWPATSFPSATLNLDLLFSNSSVSITSLKCTDSFSLFGTSIPTACLPGIGASILIVSAAKFNAISSARFVILEMRTPAAGLSSYRVTVGPREISVIVAFTLNERSVSISLWAFSFNSPLISAVDFLVGWLKSSTEGSL